MLGARAEAYLVARRTPDAMPAADECAQRRQRRGEHGYECWSLTIEGEAALANGDWEPA